MNFFPTVRRIPTLLFVAVLSLILLGACEKEKEEVKKEESAKQTTEKPKLEKPDLLEARKEFVENDRLTLQWKVKVGKKLLYNMRQVGELILMVPDDNKVVALDRKTGKVAWEFAPGGLFLPGSLSFVGETGYIGARKGLYYAFNAKTGKMIWESPLEMDTGSGSLLFREKLYVPTTFRLRGKKQREVGKAKLLVVDPATGKKVDEIATDNYHLSTPKTDGKRIYLPGVYFAHSKDGESQALRILALDPDKNYEVVWQMENRDGYVKKMTIEDGILNYVGYKDFMVGLNADTGETLYRPFTGNWTPSFTLLDGVLYTSAANNKVMAYDQKTGKVVWTRHIVGTRLNAYIPGAPTVRDGKIYWLSMEVPAFMAADAKTGKTLWIAPVKEVPQARVEPLMIGNMVYIAGIKGDVAGYKMKQ